MESGTSVAYGRSVPLLEASGGSRESKERGRWWKRVLDVDEAKHQLLFSIPMILTNVFYYMVTLVSVMFAGHLGELELAGATMANSWGTVTGFAFMTGLSGALETLCGQSFGAKKYKMLGIYLQASCVISFLFSMLLSIVWFYTEPILIYLHQDHQISKAAGLYLKYLIPGLFAFGFLENILRFLQTQSVVTPLVILSMVPTCIHVGISYALVHYTTLGFRGAALAASLSLWTSLLLVAVYVIYSNKFEDTWGGFTRESFHYIIHDLKLALPSAAMVCLEYWAFEMLVVIAGLMPNTEITTSLIAMCVNTETVIYMLIYGLAAAASTRVSNELGAGNPDRAKNAMAVTLKLSVLLAVSIISALLFGHNRWAGFFTDSAEVTREFAFMAPYLALSIGVDSVQGVLSGVTRGCGCQHLVVCANLATFYMIGMPIGCLLGFKFQLHAKGLWIGLICGLASQAGTLLIISMRTNRTNTDLAIGSEKENNIV